MKRLLLILALICASVGAHAQGTWSAVQSVNVPGMTNGHMFYQYLLLNYSPTSATKSPILVYEHENSEGDKCYPNNPGACAQLTATLANGGSGVQDWYNNSAFQSRYCGNGCIVVSVAADQTSDPSGSTSNFGGYADSGTNPDPNEKGVIAVIQTLLGSLNADPNRVYVTGDSLGGIGSYAIALDYGINTGTLGHIITAVMPFSGSVTRTPPVTPPQGPESANNTSVTTVGPTLTASSTPGTAGNQNTIAITSAGGVSVNGASIGGANVVQLLYVNHTAYQRNNANLWFGPITAGGSGSAVVNPSLPPALIAKGLTTWVPVFFDDFTTAATLQPNIVNQVYNSSFKWFAQAGRGGSSPVAGTNYNALTTTLAANIGNGAPNAGANPSPNGGVFQILGSPNIHDNSNWATAVTPDCCGTGRIYKYYYVEFYAQYNHAQFAAGIQGGWPALWGYTNPNPNNGNVVETDFMEDQGVSPYWTIGDPGPAIGSGIVAQGDIISTNEPNGDAAWHTYGILWRQTGTNKGEITYWYDNVQVPSANAVIGGTTTIPTGTGGQVPDYDFTSGSWFVIGVGSTGLNKPLNLDWVRVWQAGN